LFEKLYVWKRFCHSLLYSMERLDYAST
jgi:hypothetical protein